MSHRSGESGKSVHVYVYVYVAWGGLTQSPLGVLEQGTQSTAAPVQQRAVAVVGGSQMDVQLRRSEWMKRSNSSAEKIKAKLTLHSKHLSPNKFCIHQNV